MVIFSGYKLCYNNDNFIQWLFIRLQVRLHWVFGFNVVSSWSILFLDQLTRWVIYFKKRFFFLRVSLWRFSILCSSFLCLFFPFAFVLGFFSYLKASFGINCEFLLACVFAFFFYWTSGIIAYIMQVMDLDVVL